MYPKHLKHFKKQHNGTPNGTPHKADRRPTSLSQKREALLPVRKSLPIWAHQDEIRSSLAASKDVLILVGETGSGKSTQVPQFLLAEPWLASTQIAITQPRRVAAISLARRVADEMGSPLGNSSPASKVGYAVRFDTNTSPSTKIKFLTEGMLLQELLRDPWLKAYGAVVVDEVHERSVNVDLVLGFLRRIVCGNWEKGRNGRRLKVVVMSATADTERLLKFFDQGFAEVKKDEGKSVESKKETKESKEAKDGTEEEWQVVKRSKKDKKNKGQDGTAPKASSEAMRQDGKLSDGPAHHESISTCHIEGRMFPVKTSYLPEPTQDFVEAALKTIFQVHYKEPLPGDVLVFLTGQDTVETLEKLVNEYAAGMGPEVPKASLNPLTDIDTFRLTESRSSLYLYSQHSHKISSNAYSSLRHLAPARSS